MASDAYFSHDGRYRWWLHRHWSDTRTAEVAFVMLNPSKADGEVDDPTLRKCRGFAQRWGFGGLWVVNLFALKATNPNALLDADPTEIVGAENDSSILYACMQPTVRKVVIAWGVHRATRLGDERRTTAVLRMLRDELKFPLEQLGRTKNGQSWHPLMAPYSTPLVEEVMP